MEQIPAGFAEKISAFDTGDRERILKALDMEREQGAATALAISIGAASMVIDLGLDADAVIAALISPAPGLKGFSAQSAAAQFGPVAARLVEGVEKIGRLPAKSATIHEANNIRNMIFALTGDIRVIIIKLAEILSALRGLDASPGEERRKAAARECLDIYAPLAGRLGLSWIKNEMEDLSLKFINREAYQQIKDLVAETRDRREDFLEYAQRAVREAAEAAGINVDVSSRAKHFYSVYMKMRKRGKSAGEIYDLSGIRIICDSIENCYTLLGLVHRLWKPLSGGFDDYIARPKPSGYQSLHTTVMAGEGRRLEIQIRTREMQEVAENGIASHWLYKRGSSRELVRPGDVDVVNRLKQWRQSEQGNKPDTGDFSGPWLEEIKGEILRDSIYVLSPQGKVIRLPAGATAIDFAYHIHSAIGEHCMGAKANGSIIPLSSELKSTQVIEILTGSSAHPHPGWLETVKTSKARNKIRSWLERNLLPKPKAEIRNDESAGAEKSAAEKKPAAEAPAVLAGRNIPLVQKVIQPLESVLQVRIGDEKNLMIRFAHCCNPVPDDSIIGYVSRGRGVIIHRNNCANLLNIPDFEKRKIQVQWENSSSALVKRFRVLARLSADLFSEIEGAIRKRQGHLIEGRLEETPVSKETARRLTGYFVMQLAHVDDLKPVLKNIRSIPGILEIQQL